MAYFAGEANWNYFAAPFILARSDFTTEETGPWHEDGLLRRLDYSVDILGGGPAVHYPSEYREFDGVMVPTRRRVYVRNPDGSPVRDSVSIAIDVTFT